MAGKKALCVGINKFENYPQFALNGCVNDARDMSVFLKDVLDFKTSEIKVLTDAQATKANIMDQLQAMVDEAKAGKLSYLVFSLSTHGTQMPDTNGDESDGVDEAFVPYDIAQKGNEWHPDHIISDDEFNALFAQLPDNVLLEAFLDTCHSGTGFKDPFSPFQPRPRFIPPPSHKPFEKIPKAKGKVLSRVAEGVTAKHHVLWTGCRADQTSADAYFSGRYNGAFTYYFLKNIRDGKNKLTRAELRTRILADMKGKFEQIPQLELDATNRKKTVAG